MEIINSYETYQKKLKDYRRNYRIAYFNNYLMKKDLELLIAEGKLFYVHDDKSFTVLEDEKDQYRMHFFTEESLPSTFPSDRPVHFDYVSRDVLSKAFLEEIKKSGFSLFSENLVMQREEQGKTERSFVDYQLENLSSEDALSLRTIWLENLSDEVNPIPSLETMLLERKEVFVLKKNGVLLGGTQIKQQGRFLLIEHFAIDKTKQRLGLGQIMFEKLLERFPNQAWTLWVQETNHAALRFYEKNGFVLTGKRSYQFKRKV